MQIKTLLGPNGSLPKTVFGFGIGPGPMGQWLVVPHWFFATLAAGLAALPWFQQKWKFSLRTLLIATTLVAVVLGLIVWVR